MASTYSTNLAIELIGTGDQAGTWGNTTNTNLGTLIEQAISGYVTQAVSTGTDTTITIPNGATGVARNMYIELTGTGGASTNLIVPANKKLYFIFNNTSSGQVTVKVSGQTGVSVPNKAKVILVSDGTDIIDATNYIGSAVIGNITATSGTITTLASTSAIITTLTSTSAGITTLSSGSANITQLNSTSGTISTLASTSAAITTLSGTTLTYSSASITNLTATSLVLSNLSIASANITTLTSSSATISTTLALSGGTANGVLYLNGSKVATSGSALTFDGTTLTATRGIAVNSSGTATSGFYNGVTVSGYDALGWTGSSTLALGGYRASQWTDISFYVSGSAAMALTSTGLGIGTSSPGFLLDVSNTSTAVDYIAGRYISTAAASGESQTWLKIEKGSTYGGAVGGYISQGVSAGLLFGTQNGSSTPTERMRIDGSTGNVGIGTSSPISKLSVVGSGTAVTTVGGDQASNATIEGPDVAIGASFTSQLAVLSNSSVAANAGGGIAFGAKYSGNAFAYFGAIKAGKNDGTSGTFAGYLSFATRSTGNLTEQMRLDSSGNLGLGVTPSAWSSSVAAQVGYGAALSSRSAGNTASDMTHGAYWNGSNWLYQHSSVGAARYQMTGANAGSTHAWFVSAGGTAGNAITFTQALTLDASGNLGVGTTSPDGPLQVSFANAETSQFNAGAAVAYLTNTNTTNNNWAQIFWTDSDNGAAAAAFGAQYTDHTNDYAALSFSTRGASGLGERARITSGGYFKASNDGVYVGSTGSYHELRSTANETGVIVQLTNATLNQSVNGIQVNYSGASPNGTSAAFLYCNDSTTLRASIRSNGGLANYQSNNVDLSDARTKKEINPAASMWDKIGALEIVTYKYNDQTHDDVNLGVIAQQVEAVEPVWVDSDGFGETPEDGVPLKTVYTKDITFAAIKALQEAMARIEKLEAEVAALKGA